MSDKLKAEKTEAELLSENGFFITIGKRKFHIKPLPFGVIAEANRYATQIKYNVNKGDINEIIPMYQENTKPLLNFIAVCILGRKCKIPFAKKILAKWLSWNLTPNEIMPIITAILQMYGMQNFIPSIRILAETTVTTPRKTERIDG